MTAAHPGRDLYHRFDGHDGLEAILDASDEEVLTRLGKPALVRIPGSDARPRARLLACLLHGNEDSGYRAVLELLRSGVTYPFDLWVLIGNVRAASTDGWFAHRHLDDQEDFNRVWGAEPLTTRMRRCAAAILDELAGSDLEAAVDLHNNTGSNPFYAVLPSATADGLALAAACTDTVLLWSLPAHTLMEALSRRCPTIAVECGLPGVPEHAGFAATIVKRFLAADRFEDSDRRPERLFEMRQRLTVRPEVAFAFGGVLTDELDLVLAPTLDGYNFGMLLAGTVLGRVHPGTANPLLVQDMGGRDVTDRLLTVTADGRVRVAEDLTPVMMTTNARQVRRDCLGYFARRRA